MVAQTRANIFVEPNGDLSFVTINWLVAFRFILMSCIEMTARYREHRLLD